MQAILFPDISPVAFSVMGFHIYWYSFAYILGFLLGYLLIHKLNKTSQTFSEKAIEDLLFFGVMFLVAMARLGFVLFYDFANLIADPMLLFRIRDGGMSFHGGLVGLIIASIIVVKKHHLRFLKVTDMIACVAPIGLFLGRIANFINAEMYGKVSTLPWAVIFPNAGPLPRHPTQIYEALLEGVLLFIIMQICFRKSYKTPGHLSGIFLVTYGIVRFLVEFLKQADDGMVGPLTMGQFLCLPMLIVGIVLLLLKSKTYKKERFTPNIY